MLLVVLLEEFVPDAIMKVQGRVCLVDGTITPCCSYDEHPELWSRKKGTTGFNGGSFSYPEPDEPVAGLRDLRFLRKVRNGLHRLDTYGDHRGEF